MGNTFNYLKPKFRRGTKRGIEVLNGDDVDEDQEFFNELDRDLHTPKRRKIMSTSQYIYKALFEDGQNSDITIMALDHEWKLHKVYLCQSPYFASMFSGAWKETNDDRIEIEIADPNVNIEALKIVLGSLYQDEIIIEAAQVIPVLGAAILFQMDPLIRQCCHIMKESVNIQTVIFYHEMATQYGLETIASECFDWLLRNLLSYIPEYPKTLRSISPNLMSRLVASSKLFVVQTEFSIYLVLKMWVFLRANLDWDVEVSGAILEAHRYFQETHLDSRGEDSEISFLMLKNGLQYREAFAALRLQHLINHHMDIEMLELDNILPRDWLSPVFRTQWYRMLRISQSVDRGPKELSEEEFNETSFRCGRVLSTDTNHMWRWTGFNFGLDLIVMYDKRTLRLKRNNIKSPQECTVIGAQQTKRHIMYRITLASIDEKKGLMHTCTTGIKTVTLMKNEDIRVLSLENDATFPLILNANFAFVSPLEAIEPLGVGRDAWDES